MIKRNKPEKTLIEPGSFKDRIRSIFGKGNRKTLVKTLVIAAIGLLVLGFALFAGLAAWVSRSLPDPNVLSTREVPQSTKIFDRTGQVLLYEIHGDEKRTLVKITDLPNYVKNATVAIEDRMFYEHHGIYWFGLFRAVVNSVLHQTKIQGTSTLTQQLVKNAILTNERSLTRKFKEFILSLQIERVYTKDQILQMYLNEIPYGSNIYGVESASQTYFGKSAKDLTLDEAALLASIPQAPDFYSPYGTGSRGDNRDALVGRQHRVLDDMVAQNYISQAEADAAKEVDTLKKIKSKDFGNIKSPHFVMYVKSLLSDTYGIKRVEQGGLNVITTLDWDKEQVAEQEVKNGVDANGAKYKFTNAALVSLDPKTGQILAMVGSKDFNDVENDGQVNVTLRPRQPGSSFKPIVYAVGFMRGYTPDTQLWDVNTVFKTDMQDYNPQDYDSKERGPVSIRQALQGSLNIPAVKMLYLVGVGRVLDFAETLGYTTFADRSRFGLSLVLGGGEVTPLEHANAFAAFATEGTHYPTSAILKVTDPTGSVLEEWKQPQGQSVMDPQIARTISNVLSDNNARTYVFGARNFLTLPDRPVASKTGTTNNYHDAWTVGYTPSLVTAVWVGNNNNAEMSRGADGSKVAAPIWQAYMRKAVKGMPVENFIAPNPPTTDKPALLGQVVQQKIKIDKLTGNLASDVTPPDLVVDQTYYQAHCILFYVDKDDPTGPPPTNPADDPQFNNWETAVQTWVQKSQWNATSTTVMPTVSDTAATFANAPKVTIRQPGDGATIETRQLNMDVGVESDKPIIRLEISIDGKPITVVSNQNQFWITIPPEVAPGVHTLTVTAVDELRNNGYASVNINLSNGDTTPAPQSATATTGFIPTF